MSCLHTSLGGKTVPALSAAEVALIAAGAGSAYSPTPGSGGSIFGGAPALQWLNPRSALSQQVYLGSDYDAVRAAAPGSPEHLGSLCGNEFLSVVTNGTWYWRVDEVYAGQTIKGPVWFFSYSSGDPLGRWKCDETSGTTAVDCIGAGMALTSTTRRWPKRGR